MSEIVKAAVRLRDGMRCIDCDMTNEQHVERYGCQLHVHRLTPGSPYSLEGCVTACVLCHKKRHRKPRLLLLKRTLFLLHSPAHRALKIEAARAEVSMSELAEIAFAYCTSLLASGEAPESVLAAIEKARQKKKPPLTPAVAAASGS
jgi:hypothetical protein